MKYKCETSNKKEAAKKGRYPRLQGEDKGLRQVWLEVARPRGDGFWRLGSLCRILDFLLEEMGSHGEVFSQE